MDQQIYMIIYKNMSIFDRVVITPNVVIRNLIKDNDAARSYNLHLCKKGCDAYLISAYIETTKRVSFYRKCAFKKLLKFCEQYYRNVNDLVIFLKLLTPRRQFLDYKWNERIVRMAREHQEIDYAMSWLSTLGGAFSALGEEFDYCAQMAGKISIKQFRLALHLGDPSLIARCKLYAALSLIQQHNLKLPKRIIPEVYKFAVKEKDIRLQKICHGIWVKLKYHKYFKKQTNKNSFVKNFDHIK